MSVPAKKVFRMQIHRLQLNCFCDMAMSAKNFWRRKNSALFWHCRIREKKKLPAAFIQWASGCVKFMREEKIHRKTSLIRIMKRQSASRCMRKNWQKPRAMMRFATRTNVFILKWKICLVMPTVFWVEIFLHLYRLCVQRAFTQNWKVQ